MDQLLCLLIYMITALSGLQARLPLPLRGSFERWEKGKKIKLLLAGCNGARNTGSDVRTAELQGRPGRPSEKKMWRSRSWPWQRRSHPFSEKKCFRSSSIKAPVRFKKRLFAESSAKKALVYFRAVHQSEGPEGTAAERNDSPKKRSPALPFGRPGIRNGRLCLLIFYECFLRR